MPARSESSAWMMMSSPGSRTLSCESVTTTATSMSLSLTRSSPVISQSIQTRLFVALSATFRHPTHRRSGAPATPAPAPPIRAGNGRSHISGAYAAVSCPDPAEPHLSSTTSVAPRPGALAPAPQSLRSGLRHPVALLRWFWQACLTPGQPGRATSQQELRWIYTAWLVAFALKMFGSTWDVSWHFRWLRDNLAPPHLLNSAGTALVVALVVFSSYTGFGVDRRALRLMQGGTATFLIAIPIDILNH